MLKVFGGYTILEIMIFLFISTALIASASIAVGGSNAHSQFSQGMRDVNSKIQDWIGNVINGFPGDNNQSYACRVTGKPKVTSGSVSASPDCIFIGKAIQFTDSSGNGSVSSPDQPQHLYAYSVFGSRTYKDAGGNTTLSDNYYDSNPTAVTGTNGTGTDLTEDYTMTGGIKILSIHSTSSLGAGQSHLAGFFSSFNTEQNTTQNGAESLNAVAFPIDINQKTANSAGGNVVFQCLELNPSSACKLPVAGDPNAWPPALQSIQLCFGNDNNNDTAVLTISSNNGLGVQTALDFKVCS